MTIYFSSGHGTFEKKNYHLKLIYFWLANFALNVTKKTKDFLSQNETHLKFYYK